MRTPKAHASDNQVTTWRGESVKTMKFGIAFANIGPNIEPERGVAWPVGGEGRVRVDLDGRPRGRPAGYRSTYPYDPSGRLPSGEDAPFPDSLIWLAFVARSTSTIRLATGILILPERNPVILAKELATLDYLSSGRVTLGVGIGWLKEEFEALGVPFEKRGLRTEEAIAAMRALWRRSGPVSRVHGKLQGRLFAPQPQGAHSDPHRRS